MLGSAVGDNEILRYIIPYHTTEYSGFVSEHAAVC